jgi:hypothetical protein
LVRARREEDGSAAALVATATIMRELYGLALLIGLLVGRSKRNWLLAIGVVVSLAGLHVVLARDVIAAHGHQVALGNEPITLHSFLRFISPGDRSVAFALGIVMLMLGFVGLARNLVDRTARILLPFAAIMLPLGVIATRSYWNLTYGPAVSAFAVAALSLNRKEFGPDQPLR